MKKFLVAAAFSSIVLAVLGMGLLWLKAPEAVPALGQNSERRTITVSGEGRIAVKPDVVRASVGVETSARTAQEALRENNSRSTAVINKLKELGIAEKDIQTASFSVGPQYDQNGRLTGYRVAHILRFTVRQLDRPERFSIKPLQQERPRSGASALRWAIPTRSSAKREPSLSLTRRKRRKN